MRSVLGPFPKDEVRVVGAGASGEAADQDACVVACDEVICELLGCGNFVVEHVFVPRGALEVVVGELLSFHCLRVAGIEDGFAVDAILAEGQGMKRATKRAGFADCDEHIERGVESGEASAVEASAVKLCALPRQWIPGPFRIVRAAD